jgi:mannose-6-phosphate isomerase
VNGKPIELLPIFRERVWGREDLRPYFPEPRDGRRIGEVWFSSEENLTAAGKPLGELIRDHPEILGSGADRSRPGICPLLVKIIFTSERLSIQVHPDDEYAGRHHQSLGKTEAWYVMDSQAEGEVAVGFRERLTVAKLKSAARSGEIEKLLHWRKVRTGDVVFVPAGTVHAIGEGLTICEIQENSDITYRLYDYGRPRELHLEQASEVVNLRPNGCEVQPRAVEAWRDHLVDCRHFRIERLRPRRSIHFEGDLPYYLLLICVKGAGTIADQAFAAGKAWIAPAGGCDFAIEGAESEWILSYTADQPLEGMHGV